jgi:hypothetical protein
MLESEIKCFNVRPQLEDGYQVFRLDMTAFPKQNIHEVFVYYTKSTEIYLISYTSHVLRGKPHWWLDTLPSQTQLHA